jgi:hypothetical protein
MFGLFGRRGSSPDDVVNAAMRALRTLASDCDIDRDGLTLKVARGDRKMVWHLDDEARLAPTDPSWRDRMLPLAREVLTRKAPTESTELVVRVRNEPRVPADWRNSELAVEHVVGDLWALYGRDAADGISVKPWSELPGERQQVRSRAAGHTLGLDFAFGDMLSPLARDIPIYTNAKFVHHIAAALVMPTAWWSTVLTAFTQAARVPGLPPCLVIALPAPSRIFLTPLDLPEVHQAMRTMIEGAVSVEEELLSRNLFRFDHQTWTVVG